MKEMYWIQTNCPTSLAEPHIHANRTVWLWVILTVTTGWSALYHVSDSIGLIVVFACSCSPGAIVVTLENILLQAPEQDKVLSFRKWKCHLLSKKQSCWLARAHRSAFSTFRIIVWSCWHYAQTHKQMNNKQLDPDFRLGRAVQCLACTS